MDFLKHLLIFSAVLFFGCKTNTGKEQKQQQPESIIDRLQTIHRDFGLEAYLFKKSLPLVNPGQLDSALDVHLSSESFSYSNQKKLSLIKKIIYENGGITFDTSAADIDNFLPSQVWADKKGTCMGVSLLFLSLAEKLNVPLSGVMLPGHFFVRFDDGKSQINFEPNRKGYSYNDLEYRQMYSVHDSSRYDLRNLNIDETFGVFYYTLGSFFLKQGHYRDAITCFQHATGNIENYLEALGNMAIAHEALGNSDRAFELMDSLAQFPWTTLHLYKNQGALYVKHKEYKKAIVAYQKAHTLSPLDVDISYGLATAYYYTHQWDSARSILASTLQRAPHRKEMLQLLKFIDKGNPPNEIQ